MTEDIRITTTVKSGGCAGKIGPGDLSNFLCGFDLPQSPDLLVGIEEPDDAGVYRLTDDIAIVQTMDFFTPVVDDPFTFGQIAACNALSDVYAMGGKPVTAMNIFCFPANKMPHNIAKEIIAGGLDMIKKADCLLVGGHSVMDDEIKYGLSVTGVIHPDKVLTKKAVKAGDIIILTKPLGTGVISTAIKAGMATNESQEQAIKSMTTLNKVGFDISQKFDIKACTDVTGFGLIGHLRECLRFSDFGALINTKKIPFFEGVYDYAQIGLQPVGLYRNRDFYMPYVERCDNLDDLMYNLVFDPQTSGGLLLFVNPSDSEAVLEMLKTSGLESASIIGEITAENVGKIKLV